MHEVFLSYKAEDRARLKPLVTALDADGCSIWWDAHIGGGTDWRDEIQQHLDSARCVVVAWSQGSVGPEGRFVRDEATRAQRRGAYLPICIDPVDPPLGFGEVQAISLTGWKGNRKDPRYQALLGTVRARLAGEAAPPPLPPATLAPPRLSRRVALAGGAGIVALAGAGGWALLGPGAGGSSKRIAVLPFANLSGDPAQAYFSDGIAEELRGALSRIGLEVIGRTSSDAVRDLDATEAAAKLGVAHILTGSVRRSAATLRIGAQLVNGGNGVERWAQSYDRAPGDTIKIQTDIASSVADSLKVALGMAAKAALTLGGTTDSVAQDLYLKALGMRKESDDSAEYYKKVLGIFDQAIARDPNYADALVERSISQITASTLATSADLLEGLAAAEQATRRAIAIAPRLGSAYAVLGTIAEYRLDFRAALTMYQRAISLSPDSMRVLKSAGSGFIGLGDESRGLALIDHGVSLDPLDATLHTLRAHSQYSSRRYILAIEDAQRALLLAPERQFARVVIGSSFLQLGRLTEAKAAYGQLRKDTYLTFWSEAILASKLKNGVAAAAAMARLRDIAGDAASYQYGQIYALLGEPDRAFAALNKAVEVRDPGLIDLRKDPFMDPIRLDLRYAALLKRLKFP